MTDDRLTDDESHYYIRQYHHAIWTAIDRLKSSAMLAAGAYLNDAVAFAQYGAHRIGSLDWERRLEWAHELIRLAARLEAKGG